MSNTPAARAVTEFQETFHRIRTEVAKAVVGHDEMIENILIAFFAGGHVLIEGVPGTGKTLLALVAAAENRVAFIKVRGGELMSGAHFVGEPEKRIKDLFALARQRSPCILFLDEADAIFWGADPNGNKILAQVKAELSEIRPDEGIVVIAASNKENLIDQATRDRFEPNVFYVHPPVNDREWNEVVDIHLQKFRRFIHKEIDAAKITRLFRMQRILSPRAAAETISEAHRLWAAELSAFSELAAAKDSSAELFVKKRYDADLGRLRSVIEISAREGREISSETIDETNYPIRLYHFERAIQDLESIQEKQRREMEEALILTTPTAGASLGLYATDDGTGGIRRDVGTDFS